MPVWRGELPTRVHVWRSQEETLLSHLISAPFLYDKIKEDVDFRKEWAEKCGFEPPLVAPGVPKKTENGSFQKVA
jgi:hypothetical protein